MQAANDLIRMQIILYIVLSIIGILGLVFVTNRITRPLATLTDAVQLIKKGVISRNLNINSCDEVGVLASSFEEMSHTLSGIITEINTLGKNLENGKLDFRANSHGYNGVFEEMVSSMNGAVNSIIRPLNVAAEYVDRISKGDIPPKISDEYRGDFNEIKNNLNQCIDAINLLVTDTNALVEAATAGKLNQRANPSIHIGDFKRIISGVNKTLDRLVGLIDDMPMPVQIVDKNLQLLYANKLSQVINKQ